MRAARKQRNQHHEIGKRKEPLIRLLPGRLSRARDKAQVAAFREVADVVDADSGQAGDFCVGKNLLARFDGNHGLFPLTAEPYRCLLPVGCYFIL